MLQKAFLCAALLTPLLAFGEPSAKAYEHANGNAAFLRAPEIDGSNALLGIVLLGGIISLIARRNKK